MSNLKLCKLMKNFNLYAFIVILHHFHLMFAPFEAKDLSKIMQFLKRNITRDINFILGTSAEEAIHESLLRPEEIFWLGGYRKLLSGHKKLILNYYEFNKNLKKKYLKFKKLIEEHYLFLKKLKKQFVGKYGTNKTYFTKFKWEKSFRDHYIRNSHDFEEHLKYIYNNPFKHKISNPDKYPYIFTKYPELVDEL